MCVGYFVQTLSGQVYWCSPLRRHGQPTPAGLLPNRSQSELEIFAVASEDRLNLYQLLQQLLLLLVVVRAAFARSNSKGLGAVFADHGRLKKIITSSSCCALCGTDRRCLSLDTVVVDQGGARNGARGRTDLGNIRKVGTKGYSVIGSGCSRENVVDLISIPGSHGSRDRSASVCEG